MEYDKRVEIRYLLDVYFDGETTVEQEHRLKEYFLSEDVPADLLYAKAMFAGFSEAAVEGCALSPEFGREEDNLSKAAAISGTAAGAAQLSGTETHASKPVGGRMRRIYMAVSVAALLAVTVGVTRMLVSESKPTVYCYMNGEPVTDIDVAARQAQMVARLLEGSAKASADGIAKASEASKPMEKLGSTLQMLGITE
jgi:hypothetical protein